MDERHWWIAGKIQETFKIGGYDNPTLLEDFMCEESTLAKINRFLKAGGPCRLFFYSEKPDSGVLSTRELHVTGSLASLKDVDLDNVNILYFLRNVVEKDVDSTHMERDIFCGELKHNTIETLTTLLSDIYIPLIKAQKEWGECNQEGQANLMYSMDKFLTALNESTASMQSSKQLILKQPENIVLNDFKQQRAAALDPQLISQYEELVNQWMNTIETVLSDTSDERFMDPNAGPLSELERWRRRQRLLTSLTEQLKGKECKAVIGVLITAKSRLLKRWKMVDAGITDAMNDTKDKVKYLESLRRHFDQLYTDATPTSIINGAITGIANGVRQMDSISRYYARTGFLGLVFTKVTNQLVLACKDYVKEITITFDDEDELWDKIGEEIHQRDTLPSADPQHRLLRNHVEAKFKGSRVVKSKEGHDFGIQDDTLYGRLKACLTLQAFYRETLRSLRDALGQSQNLSHYSSISSVVALGARSKQGSVQSRITSHNSVSPRKGVSTLLSDHLGHGVSIADEEAILFHMDTFCDRIRQLMDVINTLAQYNKMVRTAVGIPRPRKDDLQTEEPEPEDKYRNKKHEKKTVEFEVAEESKLTVSFNVQCPSPDRSLGAIAEDTEEIVDGHSMELEFHKDEKKFDPSSEQADEAYDVITTHTGLSEDELACLGKYFPEKNDEEAPSISSIIADHLQRMTRSMSESVTTKTMLDVESKDKDRFLGHYDKFQEISQELEKFLTAYLHATFLRKMKTQQGLDIITRFSHIQSRPGIKNTISEKFVEIFNWYESDLEDVLIIYEANKNGPQMVRNAPPVAGAIHWARQLLKRIEDPMKVFRDNKAVNQLADFGRIVRIYNRLATALVTFESLWFTQWKNSIDQAQNGLRATLFVHHPVTNKIVVNADERVLQLIHEAKWLTRLEIQIPESAVGIMQQESRFKGYKSHLQLVLTEYQQVCDSIPVPLKNLFTSHTDYVEQQLQPGLSTLAWNSMNIDAFLHQIHAATKKLKDLGEKVNNIMETKVFDTIDKIRSFYLFDYEKAFSKSWPPEEFQSVMVQKVRERAATLQEYVEIAMDGLQTVASTLVFRKNDTLTKSKRMQMTLSEDNMEKERHSLLEEEQNVSGLIAFYRDQVYEAVLGATCMSLVTLAESAGCDGELIRSISAMSFQSGGSLSPPPFGKTGSTSRIGSGSSVGRSNSTLSALSNMTWTTEKTKEVTYLQFEVEVKFSIPTIIVEPTLDIAQTAVFDVAKSILEANRNISWAGSTGKDNFYSLISQDSIVAQLMSQLSSVVEDLDPIVGKHLFHFSYYNFLWKDDMHGNFKEFISADPGTNLIKKEVERFLDIEKKVLAIPSFLPVGPICLHTDPIKDALHGFAMAWKTQFAMVLHEEAKRKLDTAVLYRSNVRNRLELHVQSLDQLNSALHLLEELRDMENKIDNIYLPIETMYAKLREFELRLPRNEVEEVDQLREKWQELIELSEQVREILLKERRGAFEQELDKQVKTFVVEVIQFRNAFDAQGPAVPGIPPAEAVTRLQDFQQRYLVYDAKRKTLDSVSKLFGIICKPFPELDRTGEELDLLSQLYGLFQKFIRFDNRFRDTLWAEVDLDSSFREVEGYWDECLALPSKLKDWDAYNDLKSKVQTYLEVFPLLHSLASKRKERITFTEIRNRHWLQVMQVTGSSFQLEANVFKLCHLLDIGLIKHKIEIEEICRGAGRELELEIKMRMTEEEWTEQVLSFDHYKWRGPVYLDKVFTERLLEQLEDAQALLANMLTSRYIGPLRDEAASWAEKLKEVAEVLELWLEVQDLWQYLEAVFSNSYAAKELPQEAKRFARIDKGWTKMMKRAFDTRNVLQCCYGGEVPKAVVLRHIHEELEICFKSLVGYLDNKRRAFPRFYFVSDPVLLAMLSKPNDLESVRPHLRSIFSSIYDVKLQQTESQKEGETTDGTSTSGSVTPGKKPSPTSIFDKSGPVETPSKVDKRLNEVYNTNPSSLTHGMSYLPSEGIVEDIIIMDATSVSSIDGETLELQDKVTLSHGVEVWLQKLQDSVNKSVFNMNTSVIQKYNSGIGLDEWALKYPAQVCRIGMLYQWTKECEQGISEIKYDRKALQGTLKKYGATILKLPTVLSRGAWKNVDDPMLPLHKARLECMITQSLYLRDILENLYNRKLREPTDFEWRRSIRCYFQSFVIEPIVRSRSPDDDDPKNRTPLQEKMMPLIWILDNQYTYGNEFYGTNAGVALTPLTERCFLTMSQALSNFQGSCITGPVGVGKTEIVKGLANILGHFLAVFQCSQQSDPASMGRLVQGAAMDGCWCILDEVHILCKEAMSVLLDHLESVLTALKAKNYFTTIGDGQEIALKRTVSVHMTVNPLAFPPHHSLPSDIKSYFRTVSLVKPDVGLILKAKCASMSFKAPSILGGRLKVLTEIARDQLPAISHHHFSIAALTGVLKQAMLKRKLIKDEKSHDKNDSKMKDETSRSESQASETASKQIMLPILNTSSSMKMTTGSQRKIVTPNPMSQWGKLEHALVCKTLEEIIGPRLTTENMLIFKNILRDVFAGLPDVPLTAQVHSAKSRVMDIEVALEHKALDKSLIPNKQWINKCLQLYNISQIHHGAVVAGPPGSGKSTCIQTLVEALCTTTRGLSRQSQGSRATNLAETSHKLIKINPLVVNDSSLMFGSLSHSHDWVDGIFTSACRKANRNLSTTWLCLDGPINPGWADNFNSILSEEKVLHLKNGDKMFLSDKIIVLFETDSLSTASPATVARTGIVFLDKDVVGWQPIAKAWLDNRSPQEIHVLQRSFQKTLDPLINFVLNEARCPLKLSEVGLFNTCLGLLSAMLADNIEIGGELHIERLYLFCLVWTFGGLLDGVDRKGFSDLLKTLSSALPDDDRDICVFDYYVDESGEWDPWISRVPEAVYADSQDMLGELFVDTVDTIRTRILMDFAAASGLNVLLVGPPGSGKTTLIGDFMDAQDPQVNICKRLVFSGASTAQQLQQFIEANIYLRQGYVYGAKDSKKLKVFIDDVNLPVPDAYNVQRSNELLRQLLDDKVLCTLQKPFEWKTIEGLTVACAMSMSDHPSVNNQLFPERLLRHFAVFNLPPPQDEALKSIVHGILEANVTDNEKPGLEIDLHNNIVQASCDILSAVQDVLRPTPMPGRYHYLFTLKDITQCFQCMKRLADESMADETMVVSLWKHEVTRIIRDRISRTSDLIWFDETLGKTIAQKWPKLENPLSEHFVTFPTDNRQYQRPLTSTGAKHIKIVLQPVKMLRDLHSCLNTHLARYNEEFGNVRLDVMLSDFIISHIVRMHRVLSFHHGGNLLLIGAVGSHLATLCKLALHVADVPIHKVDTSKCSNFFDGLRSAVRLSGSEGKILTVMFTGRDLEDPVYLDAINSLLISGEYIHLFSNDELEGLLQALGPSMKREFPSMSVDPMKFFVARVKSNLHILICLQPNHQLLKIASSQYPGLLSGCAIQWMCDWPQESLIGEASYFISQYQLTEEFEDLTENVTTCLANIHSYVMQDCRQLPWAGDLNTKITLNVVKAQEKKKEQIKIQSAEVPNLPYAKTILQEKIRRRHRPDGVKAKNEVFVGPTTFKRFMNCFKFLYTLKARERTQKVEQLKHVLTTLDQTRSDAKVMKKAIKSISGKFEDAKDKTADLLNQLTAKATALEKLKAKVGLSTSLDAYLHLNEMEDIAEEEDELLHQEEYDDYDKEFDKMREATLKTRQVQAKEELTQAQTDLEQCRQQLHYAREQVLHWKGKVDRQCIERLKAFSSPPVLVLQVLEMVMMLIGKRLPSQRIHDPRDYSGKDDMSSRMSSSSSSTKILTKKDGQRSAKPKEGLDRAQWKTMQLTMTDTLKFVDMMHNVSWEDGLPDDVLRAVESYLSTGKDGELGVTGEGTLLENAPDISFKAMKRSPSPDGTKGITIAAAKYSSEDCATLVQYTIAIVEYTRRCSPLKTALERLHELEREIEENERMQKELEEEARDRTKSQERQNEPKEETEQKTPEPDVVYTEQDLPHIQEEVNSLQDQFDQAVMEKHSLEMELQSMIERLKAASEMVEGLKGQESKWRVYVKENDSNELLLANCITTAGFLTYCGPTNIDTRKRMAEFCLEVCEHHGLPIPKSLVFKNMDLMAFLYTELDIIHLQILRLPTTSLMLENACFLMQDESITAWPLICDPTSRVIDWLRTCKKEMGLVEVKYTEMRSQLENCLSDGSPLLVTDCDVLELVKDKRFRNAIRNCNSFTSGKTRFKIIVEDHEVECDPHFRLFMHSTVEPHMVPEQLAAYTSVIYFQQCRNCVEEELLDRFMAHEKSRLEDERTALRNERQENMQFLQKLEKQMRDNLSSDVRLMNDLQATKKLAELKKQFDETVESQSRVESSEASILKAREGFRSIAQRAAVCFDTSQYLREISLLYQTSHEQFLAMYDAAISHSERSSVKAVIEKVTYSAYSTTARALLERDRQIYALLLALEVEDSLGNVGPGEREFIISPNYSTFVMAALGYSTLADSRPGQAKKSFDWMTDDQFHNLQILATHFEWFQEMFDRMPKDGRETQWRNLCETDQPEHVLLPDKMDDHYKPIQRLCVVRAVRPDRIMQASSLFINAVLGKKYWGELAIDLAAMLKQSSQATPLVLLFAADAMTVVKLFTDFANRKQNKTLVLTLTDNTTATEKNARKFIHKAMTEGLWLLLHNAHNAPHLLNNLEAIFAEQPNVDLQFRLWVSSLTNPAVLPVRLLQNSIKAVIDTPKSMKDNMIRSFSLFEPDILRQSYRSEWPLMLHNLCYLHAAIQLRTRFSRGGWNCPQDFRNIGQSELQEALTFMITEFKDPLFCTTSDGSQMPRTTSWTGIRYMLAEVIYGSYMTDQYDHQSLAAIVDYWISPQTIKKDFEVARLKYRHPATFFNSNVRLNTLIQALDGIPNHFLEVPEGCHLHPNVETLLGDDQYVFTRLNKVLDAMPSSETLLHKLFPRPPSPFDGPALAGISQQSNNPLIVGQGVFSCASYCALKMRKETELWEICHTSLSKVPRAYNRDYIIERVKKIGGFTTFNNFIIRELEVMYKLLTEIKTTLQTIKTACETTVFGDQVSECVLSAADDLFYGRIPQAWSKMSGTSAPPLTWSLGQWLQELQNRCHHFEKILVLGRDKMPAYWLGAFFNPRGLLALLKLDCMRHFSGDRSGHFEQFVFQTEITSRDKDHLRDPPQDGMFVHGIYVWGCAWEKTTGELQDAPPRSGYATLPVVHLTCVPCIEKSFVQDMNKTSETYQCPVYPSRISMREPILEMDLRREGISLTRWALRGLSATIRPY